MHEDIKKLLEKFKFVRWDRFTRQNVDGWTHYNIYGWINRTKDKYKDFILLQFEETRGSIIISYVTSSAKYDPKIQKILEIEPNTSASCERVEWAFNVKNAIKLEK